VTKSITVKCERRIKVCNWDAVAIDFSEQCSHLKQPLPPRGAAATAKTRRSIAEQSSLVTSHGKLKAGADSSIR